MKLSEKQISDYDMMKNPDLRTPRYWAEMAVDNGECGAQVIIDDSTLRESLTLNIEKIIERAIECAVRQALKEQGEAP